MADSQFDHQFDQLKEILFGALELPDRERDAYLEKACAGDDELLREARRKLDRLTGDAGILHTAGIGAFLGEEDPAAQATPHTEGTTIGPYRIVKLIGTGGMGQVYEAEQTNPKRRVALKLIRGGRFVDESVVRMFQREVDTLARLKHPNIGAIYESGCTEEGLHFFAMELVRGETLDKYMESSTRDDSISHDEIRCLLGIFQELCDAVNYAHQRGVIHRDLKPSNILVASGGDRWPSGEVGGSLPAMDSLPDLKILDFGLARITDADTDASQMTEVGAIKGTLAYMSPEQARGNPDEIDLRSDVYSLGVILFQFVMGELPYDTKSGSILEAIRVISEVPPTPPRSIRGARKLAGSDLETIIFKAIEKEPSRRYQSAAALSDDIERYLTNQPILARPPSAVYQLGKLVSRNKLPFVLAISIVGLLLGFGIWMSVLFARADHLRVEAEEARDESNAVTEFLSGMLASVSPEEKGRDVTVREILDEGSQSVAEEFGDRPLVRARLMSTMGIAYRGLGLFEEAAHLLQEAVTTRTRKLGEDHLEVASALREKSELLIYQGKLEEAREVGERVLAIRREQLGPDHLKTAAIENDLGAIAFYSGDLVEAAGRFRRALDIRRSQLDRDHPEIAEGISNMAVILGETGDLRGAEGYFRESLEIYKRTDGPDSPEVASVMGNLALNLLRQRKFGEAEAVDREVLEIKVRTLGKDHPETASTMNNLARVLEAKGDFAEAESMHREALEIRRAKLGDDHYEVGASANNLALVLMRQERFSEAEEYLGEALRNRRNSRPGHYAIFSTMSHLGNLMIRTGRPADAAVYLRDALSGMAEILGETHWLTARTKSLLGESLGMLGEFGEAESLLVESAGLLTAQAEAHPREAREATKRLETLRDRYGRAESAGGTGNSSTR